MKKEVTIIEPRSGWQVINWKELKEYKDLLYHLTLRTVTVAHKQSVLGYLWVIILPLLNVIVLSFVFGRLARVPSDGVPYPIFAFAGVLPWRYFSAAATISTNSLIVNANMLSKVYFPRLILPMTPILAGLVDFTVAFVFFGCFMAWYGIAPTVNVIFLPALILMMILTAAGVGMWLSALAVQYRDIKQVTSFLTGMLMYITPVIWPVSLITERFPEWGETIRLVYGLYPMAGVIEGFRAALLGARPMPWDMIAMGALSAVVVALTGALYFRRREQLFADVA